MDTGLQSVLSVVGTGLVGLGLAGTGATALADWALRRWQRGASRALSSGSATCAPLLESGALPAISVLRPVKGNEPGLRENFEALLQQNYPRFELLVGAEEASDPALAIAREVAARARVPMRIVICPSRTGLNPKVNILEVLSAEAQFDAILISDSNVRVKPGYLERLGQALARPGVGLVTNVVIGESPGTVAALCEAVQLTTFVARGTSFARQFLSHDCVVGKSMLFRRSDWNRLGGFALVRNVLAEDYVMGQQFSAAGFGIELAPDLVPVPLPRWSWKQLWNRHLRWAQMRRRVSLSAYLMEPLLYPSLLLLTGMILCFVAEVPGSAGILGLCALVVRMGLDAALLARFHSSRAAAWCVISFVKDAVMLSVWCVGLVKRTLFWRGNALLIGPGSTLKPAPGAGHFRVNVAETLP